MAMAEVIKATTDTTAPIVHTVNRIMDMATVPTVMALATRTSLRTVTETCMAIRATTMDTVIQGTRTNTMHHRIVRMVLGFIPDSTTLGDVLAFAAMTMKVRANRLGQH